MKDGKLFTFSKEMMVCMVTQYKIAGYMIVIDSDSVLSIAKVKNAAEIFSKNLLLGVDFSGIVCYTYIIKEGGTKQ